MNIQSFSQIMPGNYLNLKNDIFVYPKHILMKTLTRTVLLSLLFLILIGSCKKNNDNQPEPIQSYRVVKMEYEFLADSSNVDYSYMYENSKLVYIDNSMDNQLTFIRHLSYDYTNHINTIDTVIDHNVPVIYESQYFLDNGLITQSTSSQQYSSNIIFTYSADQLTESITYNAQQIPVRKLVYTYKDQKLASYSQYSYSNEDDVWELWFKNEYTWEGDRLTEILNYYAFFDPSDFQIRFKRVLESQGNVPVKSTHYTRISEEWQEYSVSYFTYNQEGYLTEIKEMSKNGDAEIEYLVLTLHYETGESNMEVFNKTTPEVIIFGDYLPFNFMLFAY